MIRHRATRQTGCARAAFCQPHRGNLRETRHHMTGVDRYGFDMSADPWGPRPVRVAFERPVRTPEDVRAALVAMVKDAKSRLRR